MSDRDPIVYVVDDDKAVRHSLEWLLGDGEFKVRSFSSADEFLGAVDPAQPGCLVVDVRMPGMSGLELQKEIKARAMNLPVIIITGHSDRNMAQRAKSAVAMDFLEKPLDDAMLIKLVREALEKSARESGAQA
ncbi:MAG: response regulator [Alphaproteobacteria bacterium]|nr:response regulator [Alphaproteobacteria bacterium]